MFLFLHITYYILHITKEIFLFGQSVLYRLSGSLIKLINSQSQKYIFLTHAHSETAYRYTLRKWCKEGEGVTFSCLWKNHHELIGNAKN